MAAPKVTLSLSVSQAELLVKTIEGAAKQTKPLIALGEKVKAAKDAVPAA
jgi:hypothetical protein